MAMQNGILVSLKLWLPYDGKNLESMEKASGAAKALTGEKLKTFIGDAVATVEENSIKVIARRE